MNPAIVFSANKIVAEKRQNVGGFADRLKGAVTCYIFSILSGREFFIDWDHPIDISRLFTPNTVPWKLAGRNISGGDHVKILDFIDPALRPRQNANLDRFLKDLEDKAGFAEEFKAFDIIKVHANFFDVSYFSRFEAELMRELDIHTFSNEAVFQACFERIFKFSCPGEIEPEFELFRKFRRKKRKLIGVQFRTGGNGSWADPDLDRPENVRRAAQALRKKHLGFFKRKPAIFFTSDDPAVKAIFMAEMEREFRIFSFDGEPVHFERSGRSEDRALSMIALEYTCLSLCDDIIVGHGGFGVTAGYSRGIAPQRYWEILDPTGS